MVRSTRGRTRSRAGLPRRPARRAPSSSGSNQAALIGGIAAVVVVVALVFVLSRGGASAAAESREPLAESSSQPASTPSGAGVDAPDLSSGQARAGKTPDRPAPALDPDDMQRAEEHYQTAKDHWNDGQRARNAGDQTAYAQALDDAFDALQKQREALRPYTDWFEEADLGNWAMPAEYDVLQRKLDEYDRLYQRVKKLKQVR